MKNNNKILVLHRSTFINSFQITQIILNELKLRINLLKFVKFVNKPTNHGFRAIHFAVFRGNIDMINYLLANGANLYLKTHKELNVLQIAAQGDQPQSLIYLIEKFQMDLESVDKFGSSVFHWACYSGSEYVVNFILCRYLDKIDINKKDLEGLTPLHLAVFSGKFSITIIR
jgi:palmitoyltransferase